jgi:hypothetical protein
LVLSTTTMTPSAWPARSLRMGSKRACPGVPKMSAVSPSIVTRPWSIATVVPSWSALTATSETAWRKLDLPAL